MGQSWARQMRAQGLVLEDPEVTDYIQELGHSLSSHAEEGQHQFNYAVVRDPVINAFAMPGGFIMINSGLFLATTNENELAGVLAHETAHVTQRHLVRGMIDQTALRPARDGGHARRHRARRDRGPRRPERHGRRDPRRTERRHPAPDQLHPHRRNSRPTASASAPWPPPATIRSAWRPCSTELERNSPNSGPSQGGRVSDRSPAVCGACRGSAQPRGADRADSSRGFARLPADARAPALARRQSRSRARVLRQPRRRTAAVSTVEQRYGQAVADIDARKPALAIPDLQALLLEYPRVTQFYGALGQAYLANGQLKESQAILEKGLALFPRNVPVTIRLAETLMRAGDNKRAQLILDDLVQPGGAHAESGQAHRESRKRCRQHRGFLLLHGGLLPHERRSHARRRTSWRSPWGCPT